MINETLKKAAITAISNLMLYDFLLVREIDVNDIDISDIFKDISENVSRLSMGELQAAAEALLKFITTVHHGKHADAAAETYAKVLRTIRHLEAFKQKEKENE